tara:strand:- start:1001 stop:1330 length:330 start_codon:yes stop_codon:yes gene_type:complete
MRLLISCPAKLVILVVYHVRKILNMAAKNTKKIKPIVKNNLISFSFSILRKFITFKTYGNSEYLPKCSIESTNGTMLPIDKISKNIEINNSKNIKKICLRLFFDKTLNI